MSVMTGLTVRPATPDRWEDVVQVMGTRGDPSRCWCQFFHLRGRAMSESTPASNRDRLCMQIEQSKVAPGVLGYAGDDPVGWCQVVPKHDLARLLHSPNSAAPLDEPDPDDLWAITCFVVPPRHRRRGVAHELLDGAVAHAASHGAAAVEGYPVDVANRGRMASSEIYHGTLSLFLGAGFREIRRPSRTRVVVRRDLSG
jgi:ribosomal protein S18 acetylase RimI-like enzyme